MTANRNRTIVVTGATGKQGGAVFRHLKQRGFALRALVRNPEKPQARELEGNGVEVLRGDFDDMESMKRALDGADGAYSVQDWQGGAKNGDPSRHRVRRSGEPAGCRPSRLQFRWCRGSEYRHSAF